MTTRRSFLAKLPVLAVVPAAAALEPAAVGIGQPLPVLGFVTRLEGCSAVTRHWKGGAHKACGWCDECDAVECGDGEAICTVLVDRHVPDSEARTFDSRGYRDAD